MRHVVRWIAAALGLLVLTGVALLVLSENGEVVVLRTVGPDGTKESRLWIVDGDQGPIVRGSPGKTWVENARANPAVALRRGGDEWTALRAVELADAAARAKANALMRARYGFADEVIDLFDDFDAAVSFVLVAPPPAGLNPEVP